MAGRDKPNQNAAERLRAGERVMVRLSPDVAEAVTTIAERERRSISQMVRLLIEEAIDARQRRP